MQKNKKRPVDKDKVRFKQALKAILKWDFATDGRKFNGNHKEVLSHLMDLARLGLGTRELRKFNQKRKQ